MAGTQGFSTQRRIANALAERFEMVEGPWEYRNREDITTLPANIMVVGSHDVLTSVQGWIASRMGYTLDGQAFTASDPILGAYDWQTHYGPIQHLRSWGTTMEVRYVNPSGAVSWVPIFTGLQSPRTNFTDFWNNTAEQDYLLWVDGSAQIYEWSGGLQPLNAVSNSSGIIATLNGQPTVGGTNYKVGDTINITGNSGTGAQATVLKVLTNGISTYTFDNAGTGYTMGDVLKVGNYQTGQSLGATIHVDSVDGSGVILTSHLVTAGQYYAVSHNWPTTGGTGSNTAVVNITAIASGIVGTTDGSAALALTNGGSGYSTGAGASTSGGSGSNLTVNITATATNSISIQGTTPALELGFYNDSNNHQLVINGNLFNYTNLTGMVFSGVTPDPTTFSFVSGTAVAQVPIIKINSSFISGPGGLFNNDLIGNLQNRIVLGCLTNNINFFSKTNDYTDYTTATPMVVGDGTQVITDSPPTGYVTQEDTLYVSAGNTQWYQVTFAVSSDLTKETLSITPVNTSGLQAAQSQAFITKVKNSIGYLSFEPIFNTLGRVPNIFQDLTPQFTDISNPIINDMVSYDFTDGSAKFCTNYIYLAVPEEQTVRIYNMTNPKHMYWEAPQTLPISRFSIIDGAIYGHSSLVNETYRLFNGYNDNGSPINAEVLFAFQNFKLPAITKNFNEYYVEGYISSNTTLNLNLQYDLDGCATNTTWPILGNNQQIVCIGTNDNSLGKFPLGSQPLGADLNQVSATALPPKFREIQTMDRLTFYEYQNGFSSNGLDQRWAILRFGPSSAPASEGDNSINV